MFNKFKIGDRVICIDNIENNYGYEFKTQMKLGTIVCCEGIEYGVKFDDYINGHSLMDKRDKEHCESGYGLWCREYNLILINCEINTLINYYENELKIKKNIDNEIKIEENIKMNVNEQEIVNGVLKGLNVNVKGDNNMETIYFARKERDVVLPSKDAENAGYDVYAYFEEDELVIKPHETKLIPTGLHSCVSDKYVLLGRERGSTGSIGMKCGAGVIDSGYRGEIFIAITNENDKSLIISKDVKKTIKTDDVILYPYSKGIAQLLLVPVPKSEVKEITVEELKVIPSKRGNGALGSSGK